MSRGFRYFVFVGLVAGVFSLHVLTAEAQDTSVPTVIQFSGVLKTSAGQALVGVQGVTFALYSEQEGGTPLWIESQNVAADAEGRFSVLLGSATPGGLPVDLFSSGASRWLGVQPIQSRDSDGAVLPEQPRVLLVSVPYALKAADAETVGGLPASAFVLAADAVTERVKDSGGLAAVSDGVITAQANSGSAGFIGKFFNATDLDNSAMFQSGSSIGLGTTTPESALHIQGATTDGITVTNGLSTGVGFLRFKRADGGIAGEIRSLIGTQTLVINSNGAERMRIAPSGFVGIGTTSPIAQLHVSSPGSTRMMFQGNAGTNGVIGLDMDSTARRWTLGAQGTNENGAFILFDFTAGQRRMTVDSTGQFGIGTITPTAKLDVNGTVKATAFEGDGSALTGIPTTGGTNTFIGTQTITDGNLALPSTIDASTGVVTSGGAPFVHDYGVNNTFLGLNAGNFTMSGGNNTGIGATVLSSNTTGHDNTATGEQALAFNTTGYNNTATGQAALGTNNTGAGNTATGIRSLQFNTSGFQNTATGGFSLWQNTTGFNNTATGESSLAWNTTGANNTATGESALLQNTTGSYNTATGENALKFNTTGYNNTATGQAALEVNTTGAGNTANGASALYFNNGFNNTASGANALQNNATGSSNTATGSFALFNSDTFGNTASGASALQATTTGCCNTASGFQAGLTSNSANANVTGSYNTFIGYNAGPSTTTQLFNATAIGAFAQVSRSGALVLGDPSVDVGIGTSSPSAKLDVRGTISTTGDISSSGKITSSGLNDIVFLHVVPGDNSLQIQAAINSLPPQGGIIMLRPGAYGIATTISITKNGVKLRGYGGTWPQGTANPLTGLVWQGGAGATMIQMVSTVGNNEIQDLELSNLTLDGANSAGMGLLLDQVMASTFQSLVVRNMNTTGGVGIKLTTSGTAANVNSAWNLFSNVAVIDVSTGVILTRTAASGTVPLMNTAHNTFVGLTVHYRRSQASDAGIWLVDCDNNSFYRTWIFQSSDTVGDGQASGVVVEDPVYARSNYFYHLQANGGFFVKNADGLDPQGSKNLVFGYDQDHSQGDPTAETSGEIATDAAGFLSWINSKGELHGFTLVP